MSMKSDNKLSQQEQKAYIESASLQVSAIYTINFKDSDKVDPTFKGYIAIATGLNIMSGNNGYIYPQNDLTRAETASMLVKYLTVER